MSGELWRQPLFWITAGQLALGPTLLVLVQHLLVPPTGDWRQRLLDVLVGGVGLIVLCIVPLWLGGYLPLSGGETEKVATNSGLALGLVLCLVMRRYALPHVRAIRARRL